MTQFVKRYIETSMLDTKIHRTGLRQMAEGSSRATSEDYARWGVANSSGRKGLQANINGGHRPILPCRFSWRMYDKYFMRPS